MIKEIFTWWNKQTFGTRLNTILFGKLVGKDTSGNKYYESKSGKRWVIYNGEVEASKIPSEWYSWMHHTANKIVFSLVPNVCLFHQVKISLIILFKLFSIYNCKFTIRLYFKNVYT